MEALAKIGESIGLLVFLSALVVGIGGCICILLLLLGIKSGDREIKRRDAKLKKCLHDEV